MPVKRKVNQKAKKVVKAEQPKASFVSYQRNKELYIIIGAMVLLLLCLMLATYVFHSMNTVKYKGLLFTKEKFGEIPVYHYYYYFTGPTTGQQFQYNLYLRNDPRSNMVPVSGSIILPYDSTAYLSINGTGLTDCSLASRDIGTLSAFLVNNLVPIKAGTPNLNESIANNLTYVDCGTVQNLVIKVQSGAQTSIVNEGSCDTITIANCSTTQAIEKFEVQAILDAKASAKSSTSTVPSLR